MIDDDDRVAQNALRGRILLRFNNGEYSDKERAPIAIGAQLFVDDLDVIVQRWQAGVATIAPRDPVTGKLADVDQLNEQIPESEWEKDLNGNPRPPWQRYFRVFLLDANSGRQYAFVNATAGASMAYGDLKGAMQTKKFLHGVDLFPLIELRAKLWQPKKFPARLRPDFYPIKWIQPGGCQAPAITGPNPPAASVKQIEHATAKQEPAPKKTTAGFAGLRASRLAPWPCEFDFSRSNGSRPAVAASGVPPPKAQPQ
jgi:hypothetical protein